MELIGSYLLFRKCYSQLIPLRFWNLILFLFSFIELYLEILFVAPYYVVFFERISVYLNKS